MRPSQETDLDTLSLHDALPICGARRIYAVDVGRGQLHARLRAHPAVVSLEQTDIRTLERHDRRSEEHTSELQSRFDLVCRLLLEKKNITTIISMNHRTTRLSHS